MRSSQYNVAKYYNVIMMAETQANTELPVLSSEDERFCISGYWCSMSNQTSVFSHVGKITSAWKQCPPSFFVTVLKVVTVKEQMGKVISRVNAQVPAGDNEGEEERGNVGPGLSEAEKHIVPVNHPLSNTLFRK